ncbi:SMAD/FHA domain-containing protein [Colletotrichum godetiae]|uniref:SMAD/FHA domain-containing protein n=1 Tax=Colletotrichum godetiae TaxID=1209918 RepID=A0AAJ0A967_9PEZI|nr:SMAD/FHA domain-containing protein [Colletotrichum godetiae]KAK1658851.1 SMAD/FHA domain-containing protein [Colletotrichum godetiae]
MGSDEENRGQRSRRSRHDDQDDDERPRRERDTADRDSHRRRRSKDRSDNRDRDRDRDRGSDRPPRKERRRSRSRDRRETSRRSRSPDPSTRKRSRSRGDRDRSDRDRHRRRRSPHADDNDRSSRDKDSRRRRHRDRSSASDSEDDANSNSKSTKRKRLTAPTSPIRRTGPLPDQDASFAVSKGEEPEKPKEKPNLRTTGLLAAASNSIQQADGTSIALKYHEPAEARKPPVRDQWKLFVFKGADVVDTVDLNLRSCWLMGREAAVVDFAAEHPSISKQHAVIQFRHVEKRNEFGDRIGKVKPYLIDLESANGTVLNGDKVAESRYYELRDKDMIKLGHSTREYVLMLAPKD